MKYKILYGHKILDIEKKKIKKKINIYKKKPFVIIINIGKNKPSNIYIKKKCIYFKYVGINYKIFYFKEKISKFKIIKFIKNINNDKNIHGILIQLPLPKHLKDYEIIKKINPNKDIDVLHPYNIGKIIQGYSFIKPPISSGIIKLLKFYNINISTLNCLIIGSSNLVGKPIYIELLNHEITVTIVNKKTQNIKKYIKKADLLITAIGKYNYYPVKWIKKKSIIIDIGINKYKNKIVGDINFKLALKKVKYITPVPGGVGPITIAMLLRNIYKLYKKNKY